MESTDISQITDKKELEAMLGREFMNREAARATEEQCNKNIMNLNVRLQQLAKGEDSPEAPVAPEVA